MTPRPLPPKRAARPDGRHARSARTRAAIARALFELIESGVSAPTAQEIADRAGVALRSIRQHFESRERLFLAAAELYAPLLGRPREPVDSTAPLATRLARFARLRAGELEQTAPLRRAVQRLPVDSPSVAAAARRLALARREEVARTFAPELARARGRARDALLERLDAVTGGRLWDALRTDLGLDADEARAQLAALVGACLG